MNNRYYVFLSLIVIIFLGVLVDVFLVTDQAKQDEKIITELRKKSFTNIKVFGEKNVCENGGLKRRFQAEQENKIAYGITCSSEKDNIVMVKVESFINKPDPTKLSLN